MRKTSPAFVVALVVLAALLAIAAACPESRPTKVVRVCLVSNELAGEYCPAETIEARRFYITPRPGEPVAPSILCRTHGDPDPLVAVDVCSVSHLTPNPFCPEKEKIEVRSSELPLAVCSTHKDPDPLVAVDSCALSGLAFGPRCVERKTIQVRSSALPLAPCSIHVERAKYPLCIFVPELMIAQGDINAFLARARKSGIWKVRFFLVNSWASIRLVAWEQAVYNGKLVFLNKPSEGVNNCPVTDMTRPNAAYWKRLAEILALVKKYDIEVIATLGDNCSLSPRQYKLSYPFLASLQTVSIETKAYIQPPAAWNICKESPGGLYGVAKYPYYRTWIKDIVAALNASGVKYELEIQNEFSRLDWDAAAKEPANWYSMMVAACVSNGVPASRIVHSGDQSITLSHGGTWAMHQIEQPGLNKTTCPYPRLMLSGDGGYAGNWKGRSTIDVDVMGRRGVSAADAVEIAKMIRTKGILKGYEWMPKSTNKRSDFLANVDDCTEVIFIVPRLMTAEWAK